MGYRMNGVDSGGLPMHLISPLVSHVPIPYFIETGTAGGLGIREAAKHFEFCHTIELIPNRSIIDDTLKNVTWHTGNSIDILPEIIDDLLRKKSISSKTSLYNYALFFLDAHYSDPVPNTSKYKECYLLEEIEIISRYRDDAILIIDDARLFYGHPPAPNNPKDWPRIQDIFRLLSNQFPHNTNTIRDDYIVSYPERLNEPMDAEWRSRYLIRYPTEEAKLKSEVKNVYSALLNYIK